MASIHEGFLRDDTTGAVVVEGIASATTVAMHEALPREDTAASGSYYAVTTIDIASAVAPALHDSWLLDDGTTGKPLVTVNIGSVVTPIVVNRFLRDAGNKFALVTVDAASAVTPVMHNGFLRDDSTGALVTTGGVAPALPQMNLTQKASDFFNGSNAPLASPWKPISTGSMNVLSHEAIGTAATQLGNYRDSAIETYNSNQYSQVTMGSAALVNGNYVALSVRNQDNQNAYLLLYFMTSATTWTLQIYKKVAGTYSNLLGTNFGVLTAALPLGVQITFIAEGNVLSSRLTAGGSPTQVLGQICVIDNTFTGGTPGIESFGASSVDNWAGGNAATGPYLSTIATDNFVRANGLVSSGQPNWTDLNTTFSGVACNGASIVSDVVGAIAAQHYADFRNETYHNDQWARFGKGPLTPSGVPFNMGFARWNGTSGYIGGLFDASPPGIQIYSVTSGTSSVVLASAITSAAAFASGSYYDLVCTGSRISVRLNGCEVLVLNDTSWTTGKPGFMCFGITDGNNFAAGNTD